MQIPGLGGRAIFVPAAIDRESGLWRLGRRDHDRHFSWDLHPRLSPAVPSALTCATSKPSTGQ